MNYRYSSLESTNIKIINKLQKINNINFNFYIITNLENLTKTQQSQIMIKSTLLSMFSFNKQIKNGIITQNKLYFSTDNDSLSSSKKYTSSFKLRSKLAQFFKHIHPDQMNQAPTKIKQQNMRSLKNFNEYIDAINQQKSIDAKLLKFYISQKTNHKSKKFYSFNLELPEIQTSKMNQEKAQRLLDDIVNALNSKFNQAQQGPSGKKSKKSSQNSFRKDQDQSPIKIQTDEERIQREQQTVKPFNQYQSFKDKLMVERLKNKINSKFVQSQKQNLEMKLRKNVSFADTVSSKPMMWARLSMQQSGLYKDYQDILNSLIDPKLIYIDEKITDLQIQQFKKKLLPGGLDPKTLRNNDYINDVCEQMQSFQPPICFLVSDHYSATQIPGFFTVPYNFVPKQLKLKFDSLKKQIESQQQKYAQYFDYYNDLNKQLKQQNYIKISLKQFKGNNDISQKILMLRRLSRYKLQKPSQQYKIQKYPTFYPMTEDQLKITLSHYFNQQDKGLNVKTVWEKEVNSKWRIFHLINFKDEDMESVIMRVNQRIYQAKLEQGEQMSGQKVQSQNFDKKSVQDRVY